MYFLVTILTGIALSLDAFSLAIIYGTVIKNKKYILIISAVVGIFHFFMPLLGFSLSNLIIYKIISKTNYLSFIIFLILGIQMLFNENEDKNLLKMNSIFNILLFAFTVSLDSFSVGIALSTKNILIPIISFSIISFLFTFGGLYLGKKIKKVLGTLTPKIGGILLILIAFYYLFT